MNKNYIMLYPIVWGWAKFLHTGDKVWRTKEDLKCWPDIIHQIYYDFDTVRNEIDQETDKLAGQNKVRLRN